MPKFSLEQSMRAYLNRYAQDPAEKKQFQPKYTHSIQDTIPARTLAITELNAAKSLLSANQTGNVSQATSCADKIIQFFTWKNLIGIGGNVNAIGKEHLIPSREELLNLTRTGLFGPDFIISLASILGLNESIPQINNEFAALK